MENMKLAGRVGVKSLIYFEVLSTAALIIGLIIVNLIQPGQACMLTPKHFDTTGVAPYISQAKSQSFVDFIMHIIPDNIFSALSEGNILQVLFFAVLFGVGLSTLGSKNTQPVLKALHNISEGLFAMMRMIMKPCAFGALGAMSFTIGKYGLDTLASLGKLMACFYATCLLFIFGAQQYLEFTV